tara:strand:- start:1340 stop:1573 length:234 start_codon:yes stop_codon:yes gene_type:complete
MDKRVRILETEVAVLGQRQTTIETDVAENAASVAKMDEKIDTIHARITNIDRRLSKMQGMLIASFAILQILSDILTS